MGTYTTNYNLFMPSIGEQGWGDLVNGNFTTIDTTMEGLDARIGTLETETDAVEERVTVIENGDISGSRIEMPTLSYNGYYTVGLTLGTIPILTSPFPISGVVSVKGGQNSSGIGSLIIISKNGLVSNSITTTQTEYILTDAYMVYIIRTSASSSWDGVTYTIGTPVFS